MNNSENNGLNLLTNLIKKYNVKIIIPENPLGYSNEYNKKLDQQARQRKNDLVIVDYISLLK